MQLWAPFLGAPWITALIFGVAGSLCALVAACLSSVVCRSATGRAIEVERECGARPDNLTTSPNTSTGAIQRDDLKISVQRRALAMIITNQ
jgi:hypothetical protein